MSTHDLGLGAMIQLLGGNEASVTKLTESMNKKITELKLDNTANYGDGALVFTFEDGSNMELYDCARSCCESRYMNTDDDLNYFVGATLLSADTLPGDRTETEYGDTSETMFLQVTTSKGKFVINTYNDHNGYYGGILIQAR